MSRRVAVIGAGISGLAACWELTGGTEGPDGSTPEVVLLESSPRFGGVLQSATLGGRVVDLGPDGFLGRRPEALALCREIGLDDALVPVGASGASVFARQRLRRLPEGLALGIPTRFWPAARSGILGLRGTAGLVGDALVPRPDVRGPIGDRAVGPLVARKLGRVVVDRLVDPLIGGIHAGSVDDMSAAAAYPPLLAAAQRRGGLMRALRAELPARDPEAPPMFWAVDGGMQRIADTLVTHMSERHVDLRADAAVTKLERNGAGWSLATASGEVAVDAVVLAVPASVAAGLLRPHDADAAGLLDAIDAASVALISFRVPADALPGPLEGTGFLVPRRSPRPGGSESWAVTACTYLCHKWPHLSVDGEVLLRTSVGRYADRRFEEWDDEELARRAWKELSELMALEGAPLESMVTRFPGSFPQYRVHHLNRASGIEAAAARLGGVAVAGAAYRGVGIPACIGSGRAAARNVL